MRKEIIAIGLIVLIAAGTIQALAASEESTEPDIIIDNEYNRVTFKNIAPGTYWEATFKKDTGPGAGATSFEKSFDGEIPEINGNFHVQIDCSDEQIEECYLCITLPGTQVTTWKVTASAGGYTETGTITVP